MPFSGKILETILLTDINKILQKTIKMLKREGVQKCKRFFEPPCMFDYMKYFFIHGSNYKKSKLPKKLTLQKCQPSRIVK